MVFPKGRENLNSFDTSMSKFFCVLSMLLRFFVTCSQTVVDHYPPTLGVNVILFDYTKPGSPLKLYTYNPGISAVYLKGINRHIDFQISISGSFPDSIARNEKTKTGLLQVQSNAAARYRIFSPTKTIQPYFLFGGGVLHRNEKFRTFLLFGPGIELRYKSIFFHLAIQRSAAIYNDLIGHYQYSLGLSGMLNKPKIKRQSTPVAAINSVPVSRPRDRDNDGIVDSVDQCPDVPGLPSLLGCPDTDGDGISDNVDICPKVFGFKQYNGCPFFDSDKDGIRDELDSCPHIFGIEKFHGCPAPDSDKDGVVDEEDSCVSVPGPKTNWGCPVIAQEVTDKINVAASQIYFKTGSIELLSKSFPALDEITSVLKRYPAIKLTIEGHTDNIGSQKDNQVLSENRTKSVVTYLVGKGIEQSRLKAIGYGMLRPIAGNDTEEGRSRNRRVEMKPSTRF